MEVVRSLHTHILFQFTPESAIFTGTCHNNSLFKFRISSSNCCYCRRSHLKVSSHFIGKATTRPNYLRKKLIAKDPLLLLRSNFEQSSPIKGESSQPRDNYDDEEATALAVNELKQKPLAPAVGGGELGEKLGSWVDQYNKDVQLWGLGSGTIFTVLVDSNGNVKQVEINEDEIHNRNPPASPLDSEALAPPASNTNNKVLLAHNLAREMELGNYSVIPRNSSVAKFILSGTLQESSSSSSSRFMHSIRDIHLIPPKLNIWFGGGVMVALFGFVLVWAITNKRREVQETTQLEKEMIRRKMKSRKEKEMSVKFQVEVDETSFDEEEQDLDVSRRPKLNKHKVLDIIRRTKSSGSASVLQHHSSSNQTAVHITPQEIGEIWGTETTEPATIIMEGDEGEERLSSRNNAFPRNGGNEPINGTTTTAITSTSTAHVNHQLVPKVSDSADSKIEGSSSSASNLKVSDNMHQLSEQDICKSRILSETAPFITNTACDAATPTPVGRKLRKIIRSVEEARKYLSNRRSCNTDLQSLPSLLENGDSAEEIRRNINHMVNDLVPSDSLVEDTGGLATVQMSETASTIEAAQPPKIDGVLDDEESSSGKTENWIQTNFGEVEPVAGKIAAGFRDNYMAAKEKVVNKNSSSVVATEMRQLQFPEDGSEFDWMKDDKLREIVFQVRENELMGRDPFYSMDAEDKCAFFEGLEKKVVQENEKLLPLHEYLHSNIDNLDYGADGISVYDPPEKFVPRWKGSTIKKDPPFIRSYREAFLDKKAAYPVKKDDDQTKSMVQESSSAEIKLKNSSVKDFEKSKIVIESSDGSIKAGKKSGKEYWQHTKKWSRGFLESYNAETDPEVKSAMKEMGKDLDRWITDKEIEEAADLINKLPARKKNFIEKKLDKVRRELELFGPQAVVSKYREYAEGDQEDYLWWLDLPHVLCIELYITEDGEQKVGFYSVVMAPDLDLDPKPRHVIAFEDPHDCKNLCYIIQAHMEMLGIGHAFVVPRPPKDAYREAKVNGFGVTVIRKGEVKLNIDKTLEEVEEEITEVGSKVYQDKIIQESSADISGLMKGVFGFSGKPPTPTKRRRSRQKKLKKPSKKSR